MHTYKCEYSSTHTHAWLYLIFLWFPWPAVEVTPPPTCEIWISVRANTLTTQQRLMASQRRSCKVSQRRQLCVSGTTGEVRGRGEEEEDEAPSRGLLPAALFFQKYQKRSHDISVYLGATQAISWVSLSVCLLEEKAWQRQKCRWHWEGWGLCVGVRGCNKLTECEFLLAAATLSFLREHPGPAQHILPDYLSNTRFPPARLFNHQTAAADPKAESLHARTSTCTRTEFVILSKSLSGHSEPCQIGS